LQIPELIRKKRDGEALSRDEFQELVSGYVLGRIPDYQIAALLMAAFLRGLDHLEVEYLTDIMMRSGSLLNFEHLPGRKVDKHSTGGVGDKTSLIIAPAVAACGVHVPMISGRGLGFSGGTLDKLESIPGFKVHLPLIRIYQLMERHGLALVGQTDDLVPADKKLYALRDVTSTVESIPLIVASIMSKKLAEGIDGLVLDVKTGSGAFMKTIERSRQLAQAMVDTGKRMGKSVVALVTDMNEPLGLKIGNSLEVEESLDTLQGKGPPDLTVLCRTLAAYMLWLGEAVPSVAEGEKLYDLAIANGKALDKFRQIIEAQEGDPRVADDFKYLPQASHRLGVEAERAGYIAGMDAAKIGMSSVLLGAGRQTVESPIDPAVGIIMSKKVGDFIDRGEAYCVLCYNNDAGLAEALRLCQTALTVSEMPVAPKTLIKEVIQ
jgi:pyrimidine-nucleoside phosphorylase